LSQIPLNGIFVTFEDIIRRLLHTNLVSYHFKYHL